ncbi:MAG: hypothetical protein GY838_03970 [bacterium]|nr:hypothetical protein [bacterium]
MSDFSTAQTAYLANADYDTEGDATKAAAFIAACRKLLLLVPRRARHGSGEEYEIDPAVLRSELAEARSWLAASRRAAKGPRFADCSNFRD